MQPLTRLLISTSLSGYTSQRYLGAKCFYPWFTCDYQSASSTHRSPPESAAVLLFATFQESALGRVHARKLMSVPT